ncbi:hypothetical protein DO021_17855 [Desulfobacter hydrogenophilus]|uniref:Uncharacterized protein n=1 Tax=Desulfobacter hydrogenophilus TaxID=2291 RepID=A0A328F7S5_9BACT|nr:hypothetical protein [Desulfobacter hydrogenophilus]NDY73611.1 hypothetical protein [Desulfobacter hydrogenophilus]QBH12104.1 hypothetical protein EYB58_03690 [Desulfobacter hydrogenophilus]RAM00658.1 hypothetical protein DO021_17855 [Desulfobacter hydrogenophilus]
MTVIIVSAVFIIALFSLGLIIRRLKTPNVSSEPGEQSPSSPEEKDPGADFKQILDTLIKLNILIRTDRGFSMDLISKIESIIDDLKALIPDMITRYPGETLTYELKKIGATHLFKTVKEYLDLSPDSRQTQRQVFEKTIESLHDVCVRSREIVDNNETAEFKTMAHFLEGKFS